MTDITLQLNPRRGALIEGHDNDCLVLVRVQAPEAPPATTTRRALNLALVIDRSGSMSGRPLKEAVRCAGMIVDRLGPDDRAAVVVYDNRTEVIVPAQPVTDRGVFHRALAGVGPGGMTALFDGWLAGAEQAAIAADGDYLSRVLLLSDGCANEGFSEPSQIEPHCRTMAEAGVSTSTCGLGDGFNEELMVAMAAAGQGQTYYGETAEDLLDPFTEEFDLLRATCARGLRLQLHTPDGVRAKVLNDYRRDADGRWQLPDLAWGAEVWALVSLRVPARLCTPGTTLHDLVRATVSFSSNAVGASESRDEPLATTLSLPTLPPAAWTALAEDERVVARQRELRAAELQLEARIAARQGDWERVDAILKQADEEAADNEWVKAGLEALRKHAAERRTEQFSKEAMYSSRKMRNRLADAGEIATFYSEDVESRRASYLRRKPEQGKRM